MPQDAPSATHRHNLDTSFGMELRHNLEVVGKSLFGGAVDRFGQSDTVVCMSEGAICVSERRRCMSVAPLCNAEIPFCTSDTRLCTSDNLASKPESPVCVEN